MRYLLSLTTLLLALTSFAQKIKISESDERIGGGKNPALVVNIYQAGVDEVRSKWKSLMKDYKSKKVDMDDEILADNAIITSINDNNTIDIHARVDKVNDAETKLTVAFNLGGAFLNSSSKDKFNEAKRIVNDFALKTTRDAIAGLRKMEEKKLSGLQDEQRDLEKRQEKLASSVEDYKQKIVDYNAKIKEAEDNTAKNKTEQEKKKQEITAQSKVVEAISAKEKAVE